VKPLPHAALFILLSHRSRAASEAATADASLTIPQTSCYWQQEDIIHTERERDREREREREREGERERGREIESCLEKISILSSSSLS
jgi:hypothetical protein